MVSVRKLQRDDDFHDLVVLSRAFFEEYQGHHQDFFQIGTLNDEDIVDYFSLFLEGGDHTAFISLRNDRIVGYITVHVQTQPAYWKVRKIGHISGLMVRKEDRREGIGTQLLDQARAYFRSHGVKYYTVYTAAENREAVEFYRARGMKPLYNHLLGEIPQGL
jgi:ribosomal protein S18 acetylase RimI-like enzyme